MEWPNSDDDFEIISMGGPDGSRDGDSDDFEIISLGKAVGVDQSPKVKRPRHRNSVPVGIKLQPDVPNLPDDPYGPSDPYAGMYEDGPMVLKKTDRQRKAMNEGAPSTKEFLELDTELEYAQQDYDKANADLNMLMESKGKIPDEEFNERHKRLKFELVSAFVKLDSGRKRINKWAEAHVLTEEQSAALVEKMKTFNAQHPKSALPPEMATEQLRGHEGMVYVPREDDGFQVLRNRFTKRDELLENALTFWRAGDPDQLYVAKRIPFAGGFIDMMESMNFRDAAALLEQTPPEGFDDPSAHHDKSHPNYEAIKEYRGALTTIAELLVRAENAEDQGMRGKVLDIITMMPGYVAEFALTGGVYTGLRAGSAKGASALLQKTAMSKATRKALIAGKGWGAAGIAGKGGRAFAFTGAAGAQTLANPWLVGRNLGHEMVKDINVSQNEQTGNVMFSVDPMDLPHDLSTAYIHSVAELGSERMGEVLVHAARASKLAKVYREWRGVNPNAAPGTFARLGQKYGWHGPVPELVEERINEILTYGYDAHVGDEEWSGEAFGQRFTDPLEEQFWAEVIAFTAFVPMMKGFHTVKSSLKYEEAKRKWGEGILEADRLQWDGKKANLVMATDPNLAELNDYTGRVLLYQDPKTGEASYVKVGEGPDALTGAMVSMINTNPLLSFRGAFHVQAGQATAVTQVTWQDENGQQSHTFNSIQEVHDYAAQLDKAGNKEAAESIKQQAYDQLAEAYRVEINDSSVDRVRLMKAKVSQGDVQQLLGGKVEETDTGYLATMDSGVQVAVNFGNLSEGGSVDAILKSAVAKGSITQEEVDEANEAERIRLAKSVAPAGVTKQVNLEINGKTVPDSWLIQLDLNADKATFRHETIHLFRGLGVITNKEYRRIVDEVGSKKKLKSLAEAEKSGDQAAINKALDALEEDVAYAMEHRTERRLEAESWIGNKVLDLVDRVREMFRELNTRGLYKAIEGGRMAERVPGEAGAVGGSFSVQQREVGVNGEAVWVDAPWRVDDEPQRFASKEEAQAEIDGLIKDTAEAGMEDYSAEDYRFIEDPEMSGSYSVQGEQFVSNVPGTYRSDTYSRLANAIRDIDMERGTVQQWIGRLKKLSKLGGRPTPSRFRMGQSEGIHPEEIEEFLEHANLKGEKGIVTKQEMLDSVTYPEVEFLMHGSAALAGTKYEGWNLEDFEAAKGSNIRQRNALLKPGRKYIPPTSHSPVEGVPVLTEEMLEHAGQGPSSILPGKQDEFMALWEEGKELTKYRNLYDKGHKWSQYNLEAAKRTPNHGVMKVVAPAMGGRHNHAYPEKNVMSWVRFNYDAESGQLDILESQSDIHQSAIKVGYKPGKAELESWAKTEWEPSSLTAAYGGHRPKLIEQANLAQLKIDSIKMVPTVKEIKAMKLEGTLQDVWDQESIQTVNELEEALNNGKQVFYASEGDGVWKELTQGRIDTYRRVNSAPVGGTFLEGEGTVWAAHDNLFAGAPANNNAKDHRIDELAKEGEGTHGTWRSKKVLKTREGNRSAYITLKKIVTPSKYGGVRTYFKAYAPDQHHGDSIETGFSVPRENFEDAIKFVTAKNFLADLLRHTGEPRAPHRKDWHEHNIRTIVQWAAQNGVKTVTWPSTEQQVKEIEGWSTETSQKRNILRIISGTTKEMKKLAKKHGGKVSQTPAMTNQNSGGRDVVEFLINNPEVVAQILDRHAEHYKEVLGQAATGEMGLDEISREWPGLVHEVAGGIRPEVVAEIADEYTYGALEDLGHPSGVSEAIALEKLFKEGLPATLRYTFNSLEVTPSMAGPMPAYSVQKAITPVMERITPITKESIVDLPVAGKINENIKKLDELFRRFPNPLESEDVWKEFYAHVSGADWVVKPPYKAIDYASGKQDPADILGSMSKAQIENRLSGAKNGQLIKKAYESGKATPADTAMFFLWSILSRQKAVFHQETAFMQSVNEGAHKWIDKAAKGKFSNKELDKYLKWVQKALPEGSPGRAALDNLNSFGRNFLTVMGEKISKKDPVTPEFAGMTRLAAWHEIMSNKKLSGRQKRRKMVAVAYGSGKGVGVGLKVISFTLLVTGNTDVFILDRVQVRHLWDSEARKDEFGGSSNVYTPPGYTGLAPLVDGLRGLAVYEALESGLEKSVRAAYKKLGRERTFNMGGFHWDTWVASSLQEVDHGTVEYVIKKLTGARQPMNYIGVREGRYNFWDRGIWYISAPQGTERMIQDSTGHWFLLPEEGYRGYINALKAGASKKTYEGKRVLPIGTKISKIKQPWSETAGYNQEAHDEVIKAHGAKLNSRQSNRLSDAFRSVRGQYSVQGQPLSPEAQARVNHIDAAGEVTPPEPEVAPAYGSSYLMDFQKRHLARTSQKLLYYTGSKTAYEKNLVQLEEAYAAAAVRKANEELMRQLKSGDKSWLPNFLRVGPWASRLDSFLKKSTAIAGHLNATGRDSAGNFIFGEFNMRAGLMSQRQLDKGNHQVGDTILMVNDLTKENDELVIGSFISTPDGRQGYQLLRQMTAQRQSEIYSHYRQEYPDMIWAIDMYIDPALKDMRVSYNGVEVPAINRFSMEQMLEQTDPTFQGVVGYTPDVVATKSLIGGILGMLNQGTRSSGRKYKTGRARETGNVKDLFTGHSIRAFQLLQEKHRKRFRDEVMAHAAKPLAKGESPQNLPEGWVMLEDGMNQVIQRVKKYRQFFEDELHDGGEFYQKFVGELFAHRGRQLKIRQEAIDVLLQQYVRIDFNNRLYRMGGWLIRNSKGLLLAHPGTMVVNAATNDLFTAEAAFQNLLKGIALMPVDKDKGMVAMRIAKELMVGNFIHRFPSVRRLLDARFTYDFVVEEAIPEEIFASSVNLQDLDVKYEVSAGQYLREGEMGAAALQLLQYGNIDVRAKQRLTYAFLKAHAVQDAKRRGLKGDALEDAVDSFMNNPPREIMVKAVESANLEFLNYADSPAWLQWFSATPYTALIMPFPRFGYHYMAKQIDKMMAVKKVVQSVPAEERAEAFGKVIAFGLFGAGGMGLTIDAILSSIGDDDEEESARERIGTNHVKYVDPADGHVKTKQIPREHITSARVNLSWYAEKMGLGDPDREEDFWWRVRNYPMISMGGTAVLAAEDAEKHGLWEGVKTYTRNTADLSKDFFSLGAGVKVPSKLWAEATSEPGRPKKVPAADPYATNVPIQFYLVEQGASTFLPGTRQLNDLAAVIEPQRPKKTASRSLGYDPGAWEAVRANHLGAVLSRWAEKEGILEPLPRQGTVMTLGLQPQRGEDPRRTIARAEGLGKTDGPEARLFIDPKTMKPRLAVLPESSMAERTRQLELLRIMGLNLKPVNRGAYEEAIKPPQGLLSPIR